MPKDAVSPLLLDKRVVERNMKKGLVTREQFDKHLSALPDVAEQAEKIRARLGAEEEEEEDEILDDEEDVTDEEDEGTEESTPDEG